MAYRTPVTNMEGREGNMRSAKRSATQFASSTIKQHECIGTLVTVDATVQHLVAPLERVLGGSWGLGGWGLPGSSLHVDKVVKILAKPLGGM